MKLHLPLFLLSGILSLHLTMTASADVIGNGVIYDVGKNHYANNTSVQGYVEDDMQCWAVAGSNAVQYWQDTYYDKRDEKFKLPDADVVVPFGTIENSPYAPPTGTRYLNVYETELDHMQANKGGESYTFFDWWMKGGSIPINLSFKEAYYSEAFGKKSAGLAYKGLDDPQGAVFYYEGDPVPVFTPEGLDKMQVDLSNFIVESFKTQGQAATINLNYGHAITCWGYETNDQGIVTALILADGDDAQFGAFRASVAREQTDALDMSASFEGVYATYGERLVLKTDDGQVLQLNATYGADSPKIKPWVSGAARIDTPAEIAAPAEDAKSTIDAGEELKENTRLLASQEVAGDGIVVGDGKQAMILTSAKATELGADVALSLDGATATDNNTGMTLQEGAMVSLYNLSVKNYKDGGIDNGTKMYLHDGEQNISNNTKAGDGAGISNQNYLELQGNSSVAITNNQSTGDEAKGGGIFNDENATVSIRGNDDVTFSGNSAARGNDIYNSASGIVNIADNDAVTFVGDQAKAADANLSIVNEGELYLAAGEGKRITFQNSALETTGKTYIGRDKSNWSEDTDGTVMFTAAAGSSVSIQANPDAALSYATLEKLSVSANTIAGLGTKASDSHVTETLIQTNNPLKISMLTMNTTDSIVSTSMGDVTMDTVVLDLSMAEKTASGAVDLTKMLTGNYSFRDVEFIVDGSTETDLKSMKFDISSAYNDAEQLGIVLRSRLDPQMSVVLSRDNVTFAFERLPEPTTGTLSLLALAGLAARRRRK